MDNNRFDTLARLLAKAPTRRRSLGLLAGAGLGGLSALLEFSQEQVGESRKRNRKKNRKQKRRKDKRKRKQDQPRTGDCASGTRPCNGTCIDNARCCTDNDCAEGQVCDATQACVSSGCPTGTKLCGAACISNNDCCSNADCAGGQICKQGICTCPSDTKLCGAERMLQRQVLHQFGLPRRSDLSRRSMRRANALPESAHAAGETISPSISIPTMRRSTFCASPTPSGTPAKGGLNWRVMSIRPTCRNRSYQNLYDAPIGGIRTERKRMASDFIFHPNHNHFHFADFAEYLLLGQDPTPGPTGQWRRRGSRPASASWTQSSMRGTIPTSTKPARPTEQGLTPGWADTYGASSLTTSGSSWAMNSCPTASTRCSRSLIRRVCSTRGVVTRETDNAVDYLLQGRRRQNP